MSQAVERLLTESLEGFWLEKWEIEGRDLFVLTKDGKSGFIVTPHLVEKEKLMTREEHVELWSHLGRS